MGNIVIKKVRYFGDVYHYESPDLSKGLNIIYGPNGTGKSTFINFIYYALSGKVDEFSASNKETHYEIVNDTNNYVALEIEIDEKNYEIKRFLGRNDITIVEEGGAVKVLPINRSKIEKVTFSDWVLEKLKIEVVEIYQGINNFKLNFKDLLRLIYHNQEPNPKKIYKPSDSDNFISDSETIRKVIFEIQLGKTYSEYYGNLAKFKESEKERNIKKGLLDEYILISKKLSEGYEDLNLIFLREKKKEKEQQLKRLYNYRESIKAQKQDNNFAFTQIAEIRSNYADNDLELNEKEQKKREILFDLLKLNRLKENLILEATQIQKIVYTHEKLNLFSADTCPYCLREVNREKGRCVCGSEIDEDQYERFFYKSDEYTDILKSKQKSVETINAAIESYNEEKSKLSEAIKELTEKQKANKEKILQLINEMEDNGNLTKFTEADDNILKVKEEINRLNQRVEIEEKRESLQLEYNRYVEATDTLRDKVRALELESGRDIKEKISQFNVIYNELMTATLKGCRNAKIDPENYIPIIDEGVYREASAYVSVRLMYYLTLLYLSVKNEDVKFPKFLLIDTPATAGIDTENLLNCLRQISKIAKISDNYQIILSTGIDKQSNTKLYPEEFEDNVKIILSDDDGRLLKKQTEVKK